MLPLAPRNALALARACSRLRYSSTSASQKLFADALEEEKLEVRPRTNSNIARHLDTVWTGDGMSTADITHGRRGAPHAYG